MQSAHHASRRVRTHARRMCRRRILDIPVLNILSRSLTIDFPLYSEETYQYQYPPRFLNLVRGLLFSVNSDL